MRRVLAADADSSRVVAWVAARLDCTFREPARGLGIEQDGRLVAGVVVHGFNGADVELSGAGRAIFRPTFLALLRTYGRQIGARRVTLRTRASNCAVRRLAPRLGYRIEGFQAGWYPPTADHPEGDDALLYGLELR